MSENSKIEYKAQLTDTLEKAVVAFLNSRTDYILVSSDFRGYPANHHASYPAN